MRRMIIDTDTASDDAIAIIVALRDPNVQVEAITVVAGNVPLDLAVKNALVSVEQAGTYTPPVYRGAPKPLLRPLVTSEFVHGDDGMGDMNLPDPTLTAAPGHAIDALIELAARYPGEIELVTLGPLTNIALAVLKAPEIAQQIKRVVIMGGQGRGAGNMTPVSEFNIYVDGEAAQVVLNSGLPLMFVGWDVSTDETFITQANIDALHATGSARAAFCVRCNHTLIRYNAEAWGKTGFDLPDPVTMIAALYPDIITEQVQAYCAVEHKSETSYGMLIIDEHRLLNRPPNATICLKIDAARFKQLLFQRIV
jgi:purine nucleosidase